MSGFVYFADIGDAITKIGHAECVGTRFDQHRKMYGDGIKLMFAVRGSTERERGFHKFFAQYRMERPSSKTMTVLSKTYRLSNGRKGAPEHFRIPSDLLSEVRENLSKEEGFSGDLPKGKVKNSVYIRYETDTAAKLLCLRKGISKQQLFEAAIEIYMNAALKDESDQ